MTTPKEMNNDMTIKQLLYRIVLRRETPVVRRVKEYTH